MPNKAPGKEEDPGSNLRSDGVILCIAIGTPSGDQVDDPPKETCRADPRKASEYKPNYSNNNPSVINLSESGNQQTQYSCQQRFSHRIKITSADNYELKSL